jgi:hypothetical protein
MYYHLVVSFDQKNDELPDMFKTALNMAENEGYENYKDAIDAMNAFFSLGHMFGWTHIVITIQQCEED